MTTHRNGDTPTAASGEHRLDARAVDLADPATARALAIQSSEEAREAFESATRTEVSLGHHRRETVEQHAAVMKAMGKINATLAQLSGAFRTSLDDQADMVRTLIAVDAWRRVMAERVWPQHEQKMRDVEGALKAERAARKREAMQIRDLREDVEVVTGRHEAMTGERLVKAEAKLATLDERRHRWLLWGVGAVATLLIGVALFLLGKAWR